MVSREAEWSHFSGQAAVVEVDCAGHLWLVEARSHLVQSFGPTPVQMWLIVSRIAVLLL